MAIGVLGTLYGGLGVTQAAQAGFNQIYGVPATGSPTRSSPGFGAWGCWVSWAQESWSPRHRGDPVNRQWHLRQSGRVLHVAGYLLNFTVNVALFTAAFRLLTTRDLRFRQVLVGGLWRPRSGCSCRPSAALHLP